MAHCPECGQLIMSDYIINTRVGGISSLITPKYGCPKHGPVEHVIISNLGGGATYWCMLCALEKLDELGVPRVELIDLRK